MLDEARVFVTEAQGFSTVMSGYLYTIMSADSKPWKPLKKILESRFLGPDQEASLPKAEGAKPGADRPECGSGSKWVNVPEHPLVPRPYSVHLPLSSKGCAFRIETPGESTNYIMRLIQLKA